MGTYHAEIFRKRGTQRTRGVAERKGKMYNAAAAAASHTCAELACPTTPYRGSTTCAIHTKCSTANCGGFVVTKRQGFCYKCSQCAVAECSNGVRSGVRCQKHTWQFVDAIKVSALLKACKDMDWGLVNRLLSAGSDPNASGDASSMTALMYAAYHGNAGICEQLLSAGANSCTTGDDAMAAAHTVFCGWGTWGGGDDKETRIINVLKVLFDNNADTGALADRVEMIGPDGQSKWSAQSIVGIAAQHGFVHVVHYLKTIVGVVIKAAFHEAAWDRDTKAVKTFLAVGAQPSLIPAGAEFEFVNNVHQYAA